MKLFFIAAIACLMLSSCRKEDTPFSHDKTTPQNGGLVSSSARSETEALESNSNITPVTFVLFRGTLTVTGAIETSGTYTMNPVIQTGRAFHCTNNLVTPEGTITALTNCYDNTTGTWRIVSGTGAYANLEGNGTLMMHSGGETWTGKIFRGD